MEPIAMVVRRKRFKWFGRPRGRPRLRWKDTIRRDMGPLTGRDGKVSTTPATPHMETTATKCDEGERELLRK